MNDNLKELLEEFPELKEDWEKLEKVVEYLENSKPNIEASMEFKEDLRKRLDTIIELKSWKNKWILRYMIPVFWCFLVAFWIFVYYKDMQKIDDDFIEDSNANNSYMLDETSNTARGMWVDNGMLEDWFDDIASDDSFDAMPPLGADVPSANLWVMQMTVNDDEIIWEDDLVELDTIITSSEDMFAESITPNTWWSVVDTSTIESSNMDMDTQVDAEVNDVMNLLDELFKWIAEESTSSWWIGDWENNWESNEIWFKDFCINEGWFFVTTWKWNVCRKSGEECKEENYMDWKCTFESIN